MNKQRTTSSLFHSYLLFITFFIIIFSNNVNTIEFDYYDEPVCLIIANCQACPSSEAVSTSTT